MEGKGERYLMGPVRWGPSDPAGSHRQAFVDPWPARAGGSPGGPGIPRVRPRG